MGTRWQHEQEVKAVLREQFFQQSWLLSLPDGRGQETYYAQAGDQNLFVKLGVDAARYQMASGLGVSPEVLCTAQLRDGTPLIVQPRIHGKNPSRRDYRVHLAQFCEVISALHHSLELRAVLPAAASETYRSAGERALVELVRKWQPLRGLVPGVADQVDDALNHLGKQIPRFEGEGLAACHHDLCNANWLITPEARLYLVDLEMMGLDDPAVDIGATLWWYYPPAMRPQFLALTGHNHEAGFENRMRVRMAMHCLDILLPRQQSFDRFDAPGFEADLVDFWAALAGDENPQGYED